MEKKKERNNIVDIMKAIMIISVMIYHLIYRQQGSMFDRIIREMIYLSMPLFFMFSGYFFKDKNEDTFWISLGKRIWDISIVPFISIAILLIVFGPYYMLVYDGFTTKSWLADVLNTYLRPEIMSVVLPDMTGNQLFNNLSPVWFIWTLTCSTIVFFVVMRFVQDSNKKLLVSLVILLVCGVIIQELVPPLSWSLQLAPLYAGIMMIGVALKRFNVLEKMEKQSLTVSCVIMIVAAVLHFFIFTYFGSDLIYISFLGDKGYVTDLMFIIQVFIGGYVLLTLARLINLSDYSKRCFTWVGRHTLVILLYHCLIGGIAADIMHTYNKPGPDWYISPLTMEIVVKSIISFLIAVVGCVVLGISNDKLKEKHKRG